jgi:hypothetical protein
MLRAEYERFRRPGYEIPSAAALAMAEFRFSESQIDLWSCGVCGAGFRKRCLWEFAFVTNDEKKRRGHRLKRVPQNPRSFVPTKLVILKRRGAAAEHTPSAAHTMCANHRLEDDGERQGAQTGMSTPRRTARFRGPGYEIPSGKGLDMAGSGRWPEEGGRFRTRAPFDFTQDKQRPAPLRRQGRDFFSVGRKARRRLGTLGKHECLRYQRCRP